MKSKKKILYIDNYMVPGYKVEHEELGINSVQLNTGIERIEDGIVVSDRSIEQKYIDYLRHIGLLKNVEIISIFGKSNDIISRILENDDNLKKIDSAKNHELDTFGISEVMGINNANKFVKSYKRLCHNLNLDNLYNSEIASKMMQKSIMRNLIENELENNSDLKKLLKLPNGFFGICIKNLKLDDILQFIKECKQKKVRRIIIKKDISAFNKGNYIFDFNQIEDAYKNKRLINFFKERCSLKDNEIFNIEEYVPHESSVSCGLSIKKNKDVCINSVQGQVFVNRKLLGFASINNQELKKKLIEINSIIGGILAKHNYYGDLTPNFVIDSDGLIYFIEINMRKGGSSIPYNVVKKKYGNNSHLIKYISSMLFFKKDIDFDEIIDKITMSYDSIYQNFLVELARFELTKMCTIVTVSEAKNNDPVDHLIQIKKKIAPYMRV